MIKLPPMPTPPPAAPTPPPPEVPQEQKIVEQTIPDDDKKPEEPKPDQPPPGITTNITGNGPDAFGLSAGKSGGNWLGNGNGTSSGSAVGWYAGQVKKTILEALNKNPRLRTAEFRGEPNISFDSTGRITRVRLGDSSGDSAVEKEIESTLTGIQMSEAPPAGMKTLHLRITELRPK
jgi:outer membrane biosynthesis protein TonB